jgi:ribosomal protein S8
MVLKSVKNATDSIDKKMKKDASEYVKLVIDQLNFAKDQGYIDSLQSLQLVVKEVVADLIDIEDNHLSMMNYKERIK